eukprot:gb/GECG01016273.1/.p1 GENE.gb/GECG01016273.1/~~gb/GECG01016273.1/.p1  ORF type:complete len:404 (+),score=73.02 gb/GECG01016273.1/:1-1212(+)
MSTEYDRLNTDSSSEEGHHSSNGDEDEDEDATVDQRASSYRQRQQSAAASSSSAPAKRQNKSNSKSKSTRKSTKKQPRQPKKRTESEDSDQDSVAPHEVGLLVAKYLRQNGFTDSLRCFAREFKEAFGPLPETPRNLKSLERVLGDYLKLQTKQQTSPAELFDSPDVTKLDPLMDQLNSVLEKYRELRGGEHFSVASRPFSAGCSLSTDDISLDGDVGLLAEEDIAPYGERIAGQINRFLTNSDVKSGNHGDAATSSFSNDAVPWREQVVQNSTNACMEDDTLAGPMMGVLETAKNKRPNKDKEESGKGNKRRRKGYPTQHRSSGGEATHSGSSECFTTRHPVTTFSSSTVESNTSTRNEGEKKQVHAPTPDEGDSKGVNTTEDAESYLRSASLDDILRRLHE